MAKAFTIAIIAIGRGLQLITAAALIIAMAPANAAAPTSAAEQSRELQPTIFLDDAYYPPYLKVVLQSTNYGDEVKRAIWTPDEQFVIAVFGARGSAATHGLSLVIWDPVKNHIVNRVMFAPDAGEEVFVHKMRIDAAKAVTLDVSVKRGGGGRCEAMTMVYEFGKTHPWKLGGKSTLPADCASGPRDLPASPSGKYQLGFGPVSMVFEALYVLDAAQGTRLWDMAANEPFAISDAALSPDGTTIAIYTARVRMSEKYSSPIILFNLRTSQFREVQLTRGDPCCRVYWINNDELVAIDEDGAAPIVRIDARTGTEIGLRLEGQCQSGQPNEMVIIADASIRCRRQASNDPDQAGNVQTLATNKFQYTDNFQLVEYETSISYDRVREEIHWNILGAPEKQNLLYANVLSAGKIDDLPLFWAATRNGEFIIARNDANRDMATVAEVYFLRGGKFFAKAAAQYDTNLPPDTKLFRWIITDNGTKSLDPQSFMRTAFQPQLVRRLFDCWRSQRCDDRPSFDIPRINTVLPVVTIQTVTRGDAPNSAKVELEVRQGQGVDTYGTAVTSPAYNLRLFRDGALVAQYPEPAIDKDQSDIAQWRADNLVHTGADGTRRITLTVALPTGTEARMIDFTAYAFNEDRVKSETARAAYRQPPAARPRPRRAFVVTFGIDDYDGDHLDLKFASSDARLMGERLSTIPGYDVRQLTIASTTPSGQSVPITAMTIAHVIAILRNKNVAFAKAELAKQGIDASRLAAATPDDIVILSFAGHGWADPKGGFYLLPSNAVWPQGKSQPEIHTLVSAVQIADRLREVDAGEIALIIDACHSAASVDGGGFKPGPMGDPGLGQLAFDKGIRILAATQAGDVALEDSSLQQGLLTFALAGEGLTATGGKADRDGDGKITLDEWFGYATQRLPSLSAEVRQGRTDASGARGWIRTRASAPPPVQEPALFDFNSKASGIILKTDVRP